MAILLGNIFKQCSMKSFQYPKFLSSEILFDNPANLIQSNVCRDPPKSTTNICPRPEESHSQLHPKLLSALNNQLKTEISAAYAYTALWAFFQRSKIGLSGFEKMQKASIKEERRHVHRLIKLINTRGGVVKLMPIEPPEKQEWKSPLEALKFALDLEEKVYKILAETQNVANEVKDHYVMNYLQTHLGDDQVKSMSILTKYIAQLEANNSPDAVNILNYMLNTRRMN